jgi:hypothetical protein
MKALEIESWALRILERVEKNLPPEDSKVELKSEWPADFSKTARQLGGHANAVRGDNILWIIGADEKRGIIGAANHELANWLPQIQSRFDGLPPNLIQNLNVPYKGTAVTALFFDTTRAPFVVKNPAFGSKAGEFELEVPWREGNRTRSATRSDLVLLLAPLNKIPKVKILAGNAFQTQTDIGRVQKSLQFHLQVYITPRDQYAVTFPFHEQSATIKADWACPGSVNEIVII